MTTTTKVEVAFATAPLAAPTWVDISSYVREIGIRAGKGHELDRSQAAELTMRLDNNDRRFDPTNTAGTYYPNVVPMRKARVTVTVAGTPYYPFTGYIEDWGQAWLPRPIASTGDYEVQVRAVDGFTILTKYNLTALSTDVLADSPLSYYRLREAVGAASVADEGSAALVGTPGGSVTLGTAGPLVGGQTATTFGGGSITTAVAAALGLTGDVTVEMWVKMTSLPGSASTLLKCGDAAVVNPTYFGLNIWNTGKLSWVQTDTDGIIVPVGAGQSTGSIGTGAWHHIAATRSGRVITFYIDGVASGTALVPGPPKGGTNRGLLIGDSTTRGVIGHVAVHASALTPARIAAHASRTFDTFVSVPTGTHVGRVLDAIGWPAGDRSLDTGSSTLPALTPDGNALDWLQSVAEDSENGLLMMDGQGNVLFHARQSLWNSAAHNTSQATFGDSGAENAYEQITARYDDQNLYSEVDVTRAGGDVQVASDTSVATAYGARMLEKTGLLIASDLEAADAANYLLSRYKAPALRIDTLSLRGTSDALRTLMYSLAPHWTRITVKRRPSGGGAVISQDCHIEGVSHTIVPPAHFASTWNLVPADPTGFWVLGDTTFGVLGTTTRLGW